MRSRLRRLLPLLAAAPMLFAGEAYAGNGIITFSNYCTTGTIKTCASVEVQTVSLGGGATQVHFRIQNLQGTNPTDNTGGSLIKAVAITDPMLVLNANPALWGFTVGTVGTVATVGTPEDEWTMTNTGVGGQVEFSSNSSGAHGAIQGCGPSDGPPSAERFITCPMDGVNTGWVQLSFVTTNDWTANTDTQIAWTTGSMRNFRDASVQCRTDGMDDHDCQGQIIAPPTVVPEPVSMVLTGSGLMGLGFFGRRRKREEAADDAEGDR